MSEQHDTPRVVPLLTALLQSPIWLLMFNQEPQSCISGINVLHSGVWVHLGAQGVLRRVGGTGSCCLHSQSSKNTLLLLVEAQPISLIKVLIVLREL